MNCLAAPLASTHFLPITTPSSHDNQKCLRHGQVDLGSRTTRSREALGHKEATSSPWAVASGLCTAANSWVHTPTPWIENLSCCNCKDTITTPLYLFSISLVSRNLSFQNYKQNNISLRHISRQYSRYPSLFQMSYASGGRAQMGLERLTEWDQRWILLSTDGENFLAPLYRIE